MDEPRDPLGFSRGHLRAKHGKGVGIPLDLVNNLETIQIGAGQHNHDDVRQRGQRQETLVSFYIEHGRAVHRSVGRRPE